MGNWNGLIYNAGLGFNDNFDWLEIERLNLGGVPEELEVNNYVAPSPTQSFIRLVQGTTPVYTQCRSIGAAGVNNGAILVLKGLSSGTVGMIHSVGNLHLDTAAFALTTYSTMVLICDGSQYYEISRSDNN